MRFLVRKSRPGPLPEHTGSVVPAQWLLTRAAIVAIAHAALYSLSCEGVLREAALSVEADDRASALMRALVALLENDGSAEPITEGWRLAPETGYAAPDDLIATLIDRFPAAQAELLLLLELRCRLPQALEAGLPSLSEQTRTLILGEASAFALAIEALDLRDRSREGDRRWPTTACPRPATLHRSCARAPDEGAHCAGDRTRCPLDGANRTHIGIAGRRKDLRF